MTEKCKTASLENPAISRFKTDLMLGQLQAICKRILHVRAKCLSPGLKALKSVISNRWCSMAMRSFVMQIIFRSKTITFEIRNAVRTLDKQTDIVALFRLSLQLCRETQELVLLRASL
jgi:hypothetical protein